jgi:hypothetical protein
MTNSISPEVKAFLSSIGRKGGASGKGQSKLRGNADYYRHIRSLRQHTKKDLTQAASTVV